ncbi:helix-turn-helix domain-containing protein [uncultured Microbacterium sp.]|uniref:helix-turn-helix domain-containing protein n=1 Tax=uncultured Microbacterium sp. TaxID=191216 RepID=UPI0025E99F09|nr:helix-turn-helix domain-containing protein [uncultured Microbacterium sp.]
MDTTDDNESQPERDAYIEVTQAEIEAMKTLGAEGNREAMLLLERRMADKFRILREERGWSQSELSERLAEWGFDLHQTSIAKLEKGKRPMRVAEMHALAHVFRMPPGAVFFMAYSTNEIGMSALAGRIDDTVERMERTKEDLLKHIGYVVDFLADDQRQLNEFVDMVRRESRRDPSNKLVQALAERFEEPEKDGPPSAEEW